MAFTKTDVGHGLFSPGLLLLLIRQHHHQRRPWVRPTPLSLFPPLYHLVQVFSWFCVILSMFLPKSLLIFKNFELKKIIWGQVRKSYCRVEKASQKVRSGKLKQPSWSVWGGGGGGGGGGERKCLLFCNIFGEELGEHVFHQNFASFIKSESWKKKKKREKNSSWLGH